MPPVAGLLDLRPPDAVLLLNLVEDVVVDLQLIDAHTLPVRPASGGSITSQYLGARDASEVPPRASPAFAGE